jgi:uncharacterized repeat protein (TIGR01451 family)
MSRRFPRSARLAAALAAVALVLGLAGASAVTTSTYSSTDTPLPVVDNPALTSTSTINVAALGQIADVDVSVRLAHPEDGDVDIALRHPDGTTVDLSSDNGTGGADFGSGAADCTGTFTTFDDEATPSVTTGAAPFNGPYKPEGSLAALDGKPANGDWKLEIKDDSGPNTGDGTLYCWKLDISFAQSDLVVTLTDSPDPVDTGQNLTYTVTVANNGPDAATAAKLTQTVPAGAEVVTTATTQGTCTGTGPITCDLGTVAVGGAPITLAFVVKPATGGLALVTATASAGTTELAPADNSASATTTVNDTGGGGTWSVSVTLLGDGEGSVTSEPAGIDCGLDCGGGFAPDTEVTFTPAAAEGSTHTKWGGACTGTPAGEPCVVTVLSDLAVTATFTSDSSGGGDAIWYDICTIVGTSGNDVLRGTSGKDVICGLAGNDKLYGLDGNDRLYGNAGRDQLYGGRGNDTFYTKDKSADKLVGGKGKDRAKADGKDSFSGIEAVV